jgi:hypothetical protein
MLMGVFDQQEKFFDSIAVRYLKSDNLWTAGPHDRMTARLFGEKNEKTNV